MESLKAIAILVLPVLVCSFLVCISVMAAQGGGIVFSPQRLFSASKLDPAKNIGNVFSISGLVRVAKSLVPAGLMIWLSWKCVRMQGTKILHLSDTGIDVGGASILDLCLSIAWRCCTVMLLVAFVDYGTEYWRNEQSLKMTKQEIRQEAKESDGNPQVKAKIRRMQREARRRRMLKDVPHATVVITNPTHYAIALEFRPDRMAAPIVTAKGLDRLAQEIKSIASAHEVPMVENRPLAHSLYRTANIGDPISQKLYSAVAEVLAFIYRTEAEMRAREERMNR